MCRILQYGLLYSANPWLIKQGATCLLFFLHLVRNLLSYFAPLQSSSQSSPNSSVPLCKKFFLLVFFICVSNKKKIRKCLKRNFICKKIISNPSLDFTFRNKISGRETFKANYKFQFVGSTPSAHKNLPSALPFFFRGKCRLLGFLVSILVKSCGSFWKMDGSFLVSTLGTPSAHLFLVGLVRGFSKTLNFLVMISLRHTGHSYSPKLYWRLPKHWCESELLQFHLLFICQLDISTWMPMGTSISAFLSCFPLKPFRPPIGYLIW